MSFAYCISLLFFQYFFIFHVFHFHEIYHEIIPYLPEYSLSSPIEDLDRLQDKKDLHSMLSN